MNSTGTLCERPEAPQQWGWNPIVVQAGPQAQRRLQAPRRRRLPTADRAAPPGWQAPWTAPGPTAAAVAHICTYSYIYIYYIHTTYMYI